MKKMKMDLDQNSQKSTKYLVCNGNTISFISVLTKPIILCGRQHIRNKKDSTYREDQVYSAETR